MCREKPNGQMLTETSLSTLSMLFRWKYSVPVLQAQYISAAVVYLDKVESPVAEIELGILLLMSVNTGTYSCMIVVPDRTASVVARICINTGFHSKTMYMVGNRFHSIRETVFVGLHFPIAVPFAEIAVINVDIAVSCVFQTFFTTRSA